MIAKKVDGNNICIKSIQMGSYYECSLENRKQLDIGKAVLDYSLFSEYMLNNGLKVGKKNKSLDILMCKFDYGYKKNKDEKSTDDMTGSELRNKYDVGGFTIDWKEYYKSKNKELKKIEYVRLCRSTGKAKEGDCLFINKKLFKKANEYLSMGIKLSNDNAKIVELSAYNTLTCANMIGSINIPLKNILILKDAEIETFVNAVKVKTKSVIREINKVDYAEMESLANVKGYTFYKNKEARVTGLTLIKKKSAKYLKSLFGDDVEIIKIGSKLDIKSMESYVNKHGYTFYSGCVNKDGYILIERDISAAVEREIEIIYKKIKVQECHVERPKDKVGVKNVAWDGMSLIDSSLMGDFSGFIYLRNHMTKMCCFEGEVVQFLKDFYGDEYETAYTEDMFNNQIKVSDIRLITTHNAIKWIKFEGVTYDDYNRALAKYDYKFEVVKTAHKSKYGDLQRMSYQGCNSLPCSDEEDLKAMAETSIEYFNELKTDNDKFVEYLNLTANNYNNHNLIIDLYLQNKELFNYDFFSKEKTKILSKFKREQLELGKLLQDGDNLTVVSNPYALLLYAVGENWKEDPTLNKIDEGIQCYTSRFEDNSEIAAYRNPHNSPNNYMYLKNHYSEEMQKYFPNLGDNVIAINCIGTDVQDRANSMDYDSDFCFSTTEETMVKYAKMCYEQYPTIINDVPEASSLSEEEQKDFDIVEYKNTLSDYARMDNSIAKYQYGIGQASNLSQLALSYYYDQLFKTGVKNEELEDVFIICSVMAQLFIDSSKKTYALNLDSEMTRLSKLDCMDREKKYPSFYAKIQQGKNKVMPTDSKNKKVQKEETLRKIAKNTIGNCLCPMDMLAKIIDKEVIKDTGKKRNTLLDVKDLIVKEKEIDKSKVDSKQEKKIQEIIDMYDEKIKELDSTAEDYSILATVVTDEAIEKLKNLSINKTTMYRLIRVALGLRDGSKNNNKHVSNRLLIVLYNYDKKYKKNIFTSLFKKLPEKVLKVA